MKRMNNRDVIVLLALALALLLSVVTSPVSRAADGLPTIDLNGGEPGIDYETTFNENNPGGPKVVIVSDKLKIENDSDRITSARAWITNESRPDAEVERLDIKEGALSGGMKASYKADTGVLTVTGEATIAAYETALRSLTYDNTSYSPDVNKRIVGVTVSDGERVSPQATSTITIKPVNDAPVLNPECQKTMTLGNIDEDAPPTNGKSVADIIKSGEQNGTVDCITDKDKGDPEGFAVISVDAANGSWQYSTDNGLNWLDFGVEVSNSKAVLLDGIARIRFIPKINFNGLSSFSFRAWDQSGKEPSGTTGVDIPKKGGTTAFSELSGVVTIQVNSVNDPPVVSLNGEAGANYSTQFIVGGDPVRIAAPTASITDEDHDELQTLTVTLTNRPDGQSEALKAGTPQSEKIIVEPYDPDKGRLVLRGLAPLEEYESALREITYANTSNNPTLSDRTVTVIANDGVSDSLPAISTIAVKNKLPEIDLDGAGAGPDYAATFYINRGQVPIVSANLTVTDRDDATLRSATVRITNLKDGAEEILAADTSGTVITSEYDPDHGTLSLEGTDSVANYQRVLRTVTYNNRLKEPSAEARIVEFAVTDARGGVSQTRRSTVTFLVAPDVYFYMPLVIWSARNNTCPQARGISLNVDEQSRADDRERWYYFDLPSAASVTVELRDFMTGNGQMQVIKEKAPGQGCGSNSSNLEIIGYNGDQGVSPERIIALGPRPLGRYYIRIINEDPNMPAIEYRLLVRTP